MTENQKHFNDILNDFSFAMLTTIGGDGIPRARPMQVSKVNEQNELWFFTNAKSGKVDEIQANAVVAISMQGGGKYLSLSGKAEVIRDQSTIDELWSEPLKVWFPEGKDAPSVILLKIVPDEGEYWDISGTNRLRYMYQAGKAYFTGEPMDTSGMDMNAKVEL